ncbi:MAG: hypothetical protein M1829_006936 [Trizodia sp. TS-e1964]|nr:MAG: hypothetical protein M1829_006936 [Trizodia sp. TS-e1964]
MRNGTFGAVYAARERHPGVREKVHRAVKFSLAKDAETVQCTTEDGEVDHLYIEPFLQDLVSKHPTAIKQYAAWPCGPYVFAVLDLFGVHTEQYKLDEMPAMLSKIHRRKDQYQQYDTRKDTSLPKIQSLSGVKCGAREGNPDEGAHTEVCQRFHGILKGFRALFDGGVCHNDFAGRNFLIGPNYEVKLIDFGLAELHPDKIDFLMDQPGYLSAQNEYRVMPEDFNYAMVPKDKRSMPYFDARNHDLWAVAAEMFFFLHAEYPWFVMPDMLGANDVLLSTILHMFHRHRGHAVADRDRQRFRRKLAMKAKRTRRRRIIRGEFDISRKIHQDHEDMLRAMLQPYARDRPDLHAIASFSCMSGWHLDVADVPDVDPKLFDITPGPPYSEVRPRDNNEDFTYPEMGRIYEDQVIDPLKERRNAMCEFKLRRQRWNANRPNERKPYSLREFHFSEQKYENMRYAMHEDEEGAQNMGGEDDDEEEEEEEDDDDDDDEEEDE